MTAIPVKKRTAFHREGGVDDIALDARGRSQLNLTGADTAGDLAANDNGFGDDLALHRRFLTNRQRAGADIALDGTIKLDFAFGRNRSGHDQITAED